MAKIAVASPFDALFVLDDWQLAALIVLLVVVPGAAQQLEAVHGRNPAATIGTVAPSAAQIRRARGVRPPRSC